ncbi:MAG: hypothetical protein HPM95_12950 [Alphaproteobacteria bacterium]|nr:hypothetical protein [Alphaproteobacteria bacterium]
MPTASARFSRSRTEDAPGQTRLRIGLRPDLPALTIAKSDCRDWSFDVDPRPEYGLTSAKWYDRATGKTEIETERTGMQGPERRLRHVLPTQAEAKAAAKSEGERLSRATDRAASR